MYKLGIFGVFERTAPKGEALFSLPQQSPLPDLSKIKKAFGKLKSEGGLSKLTYTDLIVLDQYDTAMDSIKEQGSQDARKLVYEIEITNFFSGSEGVQIKSKEDFIKIQKLFAILGKNISNSYEDVQESYIKINKKGDIFTYKKKDKTILTRAGKEKVTTKTDIKRLNDQGTFVASNLQELGYGSHITKVEDDQFIGDINHTQASLRDRIQNISISNIPEKLKGLTLELVQPKKLTEDKIPASTSGKHKYVKRVDQWNKLVEKLEKLSDDSIASIKKIKNGEVLSKTEEESLDKDLRLCNIPNSTKKHLLSVDNKNKDKNQKEFGNNAEKLRELFDTDISELSYGKLMDFKKQLNDLKEKLHTNQVTSTLSRLTSEILQKDAIAKIDEKLEEVNQKLNDPKTERAALDNATDNEKTTLANTLTTLKRQFTGKSEVRKFQQKLKQFLADNNMSDYLGSTDVDGIIGRRTATAVVEAGKKLNEGVTRIDSALDTTKVIAKITANEIDEDVKKEWQMLAQFQNNFETKFTDKKELQKALNTYITNNNLGSKIAVDGQVGPQTRGAMKRVFDYFHEQEPNLGVDDMIAQLENPKPITA